MADLSPNGSTGTFEPACWMNPEDVFNHTDLNTLAENTSFFVQEYYEVMSAYHKVDIRAGAPNRPNYLDGDTVSSYTFLAGGTHQFLVYTNQGHYSGGSYVGSVTIDGTLACTFGTAGTSSFFTFVNTGPRWVQATAQIISFDITQTIDNYYSISYRRIL
jgi:hypothetical protein